MKLSRLGVFLIGVIVIVSLFFIIRILTYRNSEFTHGVVVCPIDSANNNDEIEYTLYYYVGMKEYSVTKYEIPDIANQEVVVFYPKGHPEKGDIYTITHFWFVAALYMLLPLMIWFAFIFTWLKEKEGIEIEFIKRKRKSKQNQENEESEETT